MKKTSLLSAVLMVSMTLGAAGSAQAAAIDVFKDGPWLEFLFGGVGSFATPCGGGCAPSSGGNSVDAPAPSPWTFTGPALFTITDAFQIGDQFQVFDFAAPILLSSAPVAGGICGDDPALCILNPSVSSGSLSLGGGAHSITIQMVQSPFFGGAAYFRIDSTVPEPATLMLLGLGFAGIGVTRRRKSAR